MLRPRRPLIPTLVLAACSVVVPQLACTPADGGGGGGGGGGVVFNLPPSVVMTADITRGVAPLVVHFSSSGSTDDGVIVQRNWDFGDGETSVEVSPTHMYTANGVYTAKLTLVDDGGASNSKQLTITVSERPIAVIAVDATTAPNPPATFTFDASGSFDPDAKPGETLRYDWDFGDGTRGNFVTGTHVFSRAGTFRVVLTVTDATGIIGRATRYIQIGIPAPTITFRTPAAVANLVLTPESPLWVYVDYTVEPGVPYRLSAGLTPVAGGDDIQLDTNPPQGNDLNLSLPQPLDLSAVPAASGGTAYYLWAQIDTDRTEPTREYWPTTANRGQLVVVPEFAKDFNSTPPVAPLGAVDEAVIVMPRVRAPRIVDLGPLARGDRLQIEMLNLPGFRGTYDFPGYSLLMLDADQNLYGWYQDGFALFSAGSRLIVGHDTAHLYLVVDQLFGSPYVLPSVRVRVQRGFAADSQPRPQKVFLDFRGASNFSIAGYSPVETLPAFNLSGAINATVKTEILNRVRAIFPAATYAIDVLSSDSHPEPTGAHLSIYFDTTDPSTLLTQTTLEQSDLLVYGLPDFHDPRNDTLSGRAVVITKPLLAANPGLNNDTNKGKGIGNAVAHQIGLLLGLRETTGLAGDIMATVPALTDFTLSIKSAPANLVGYGGAAAFGKQQAHQLLLETVGAPP